MKFLRFLLLSFLLIVLLIFSGLGAVLQLPDIIGIKGIKEPIKIVVDGWSANGGLFFFYAAIFALTLFYIIVSILSVRSKPVVTIDTDSGKVHIIDSAVRKYLLSALNKMPSIHVRSIHVSGSKKGLKVLVFVRVRSVSQLNDVKEIIMNRIREALVKELGVPTVDKIEVIVDDFEASRAVKNAAVLAATTAAPEPVAEPEVAPIVATPEATEDTPEATDEGQTSEESNELPMLNIDALLAEKAAEDVTPDEKPDEPTAN